MILLIQNHSKGNYVPASVLRAAGYQVIEADDGYEGAQLLNKHKSELVIADVLLPNLGGIAIAARIRLAWPEMPIILAGDLRPSGAESILKQPIEVLQAPIDIMELLGTMKRMLGRRNDTASREPFESPFASELVMNGPWQSAGAYGNVAQQTA